MGGDFAVFGAIIHTGKDKVAGQLDCMFVGTPAMARIPKHGNFGIKDFLYKTSVGLKYAYSLILAVFHASYI